MKIALDAHALGTGAGGNETFVHRLLQGLRAIGCSEDIVALVNPDFPEGADLSAGFPVHRMRYRSSALRVLFGLRTALRETRPDLLHVQYIAPPRCPCPFVVTLHDMAWIRVPDTMPARDRWRLTTLVPWTLRRAARIFVVTEAMKREALEMYGLPEDRFEVTPNSVSPAFRPEPERVEAVRKKYRLPSSFILYVGALQPRKNLSRLAAACSRLAEKGFPHVLVIVGKPGWLGARVEQALRPFEEVGRLVRLGYVDASDLPALFSAAAIFAYVSLYEGFGLPVLEAMACGTPVLCSHDPALSEVAGGAALLCDPEDVESIENGLMRLLTDEELRRRFQQEGLLRARHFSVERMARAALAGYRRAFEDCGGAL